MKDTYLAIIGIIDAHLSIFDQILFNNFAERGAFLPSFAELLVANKQTELITCSSGNNHQYDSDDFI